MLFEEASYVAVRPPPEEVGNEEELRQFAGFACEWPLDVDRMGQVIGARLELAGRAPVWVECGEADRADARRVGGCEADVARLERRVERVLLVRTLGGEREKRIAL